MACLMGAYRTLTGISAHRDQKLTGSSLLINVRIRPIFAPTRFSPTSSRILFPTILQNSRHNRNSIPPPPQSLDQAGLINVRDHGSGAFLVFAHSPELYLRLLGKHISDASFFNKYRALPRPVGHPDAQRRDLAHASFP